MDKKRILFVDDDPMILRSLSTMLAHESERWDIVFAHGGPAGLAALRATTFDVVVTDLVMPDVDGVAVLAAAKEQSPATIRIMLTGSATEDMVIDAFAVLPKPCEPRALRELLERVTT